MKFEVYMYPNFDQCTCTWREAYFILYCRFAKVSIDTVSILFLPYSAILSNVVYLYFFCIFFKNYIFIGSRNLQE